MTIIGETIDKTTEAKSCHKGRVQVVGPEYSAAHQKSRDLAGDQLLHPKWKIKTNDYTNLLCMSCLFLYVGM